MANQRGDRPPPAAVLEKIQAELADPSTFKKVFAFTWRRMRLLGAFGLENGRDVVEELVNQALLDTMEGTLTWDPAKVRLSTHLCGAIRSRTWKRATRPPTFPVDGLPDESELQPEGLRAGGSPDAAAHQREQNALDAVLVAKVRVYLDDLAAQQNDDAVGLLLMAYDEGKTGRTDISVATGLSSEEVTNARRRLVRMLRDLPPGLLEEVEQRLKGDS